MNNSHELNSKFDEANRVKSEYNTVNSDLAETYYCDFSNIDIKKTAKSFLKYKQNTRELVTKTFLFVRDEIVFGGDRWKVKASETLNKGYGACYNKNLLFVALLRCLGIPAQLCANPMAKDFNKAAIGFGHITMSTPFYHCFTKVLIDEKWIDIDPTVDKNTYNTFFGPLNVDWDVDWDGYNDMLLFKGSTIGKPKIFNDIDSGLNKNLNSHFLFKYEPEFILSSWLSSGNSMMWKKVQNPSLN